MLPDQRRQIIGQGVDTLKYSTTCLVMTASPACTAAIHLPTGSSLLFAVSIIMLNLNISKMKIRLFEGVARRERGIYESY